MREWGFRKDMNSDGVFTISDIWSILHHILFYPGDWCISKIIGTNFGTFFEFTYADYGGTFSFLLSIVLWACLYGFILASGDMFNDFVDTFKSEYNENRLIIWIVYVVLLLLLFLLTTSFLFNLYIIVGWFPFYILHKKYNNNIEAKNKISQGKGFKDVES